jgi:hypothetical protein
MRSGVPTHVDQWQWTIAAYPASHRGIGDGGTAGWWNCVAAAFSGIAALADFIVVTSPS